jgi:hypothetical protein
VVFFFESMCFVYPVELCPWIAYNEAYKSLVNSIVNGPGGKR